jgi:hypothetical protein
MRSVDAVQSQCKNCSNQQGGQLRKITRAANETIKNNNNNTNTGTNNNGQ